MINWFWQISHKFDTKLFFGDCDNTPVHNIFGSLLDFEMTTVPHLHEYWSSRDDQDMQLYLMKKMCVMNFLLHYHHAWSYKSHTRTNWKGNARHLCDFYWRMINLQKSLVDSISNFCSAQQWSCSSFAFMCIVSPSISWGLTTRLQRMEHRSLVLFNHRHQKGSHLIPCKGFVDQNKQEAGGNVFSGGDNSLQRSLFLLTKQFFLEPTKPISLFIIF